LPFPKPTSLHKVFFQKFNFLEIQFLASPDKPSSYKIRDIEVLRETPPLFSFPRAGVTAIKLRIYRFIFNFEVLVFLRKTKTSKRYIVGWVRFFCKAKKRNPTERDKCWVTLFRIAK